MSDDTNPYSPPVDAGLDQDPSPPQPSLLGLAGGAAYVGCMAILVAPFVGGLSMLVGWAFVQGVLAGNENVETYARYGGYLSALVGMGIAIWILAKPVMQLLRDDKEL
jgi:hypothetical protein